MLSKKIETWLLHYNYRRKKRRDIERRRHGGEGRACFRSSSSSNKLYNQEIQPVVTTEAVEEGEEVKLAEEPSEVEAEVEVSLDKPVVLFPDETVLSARLLRIRPTRSLGCPHREYALLFRLSLRDQAFHGRPTKRVMMRRLPTSNRPTIEPMSHQQDTQAMRTAVLRYQDKQHQRA